MRRLWSPLVDPPGGRVRVTSGYGERVHPITGERHLHNGIDISWQDIADTPVYAIADGRVMRIYDDAINGYGVEIIHGARTGETLLRSSYVHLASPCALRLGDPVWAPDPRREPWGDVQPPCIPLGYVGSTGRSTGPHLHLTVRELHADGWRVVDPLTLIDWTPYTVG